MIVLHAAAGEDEILLWGERSDTDSHSKRTPAGSFRMLPFAAETLELEQVLAKLSMSPVGSGREVAAMLPSTCRGALASSGLIDDSLEQHKQAPVSLETWRIPAIALTPAQALALLPLSSTRVIMPGLLAGEDLRYWLAALSFAAGLVSRERFLPGLRQRGDDWYACWEPVISGEDLERFTALVQSVPDVCRAVSADRASGNASNLQPVHRAVSLFVDHFVRSAPGVATAGSASQPSGAAPPLAVRTATTNIHDRWLNALRAGSGALPASADELRQLQTDLARWKRPVNSSAQSAFRLCFRLEEPEPDEIEDALEVGPRGDLEIPTAKWHLTYWLQSKSDPSLLIAAENIWSGRNLPGGLRATVSGAREYLLSALGTASAIYAPVERSLLSARPQSTELDTSEAHRFLHEHAGLLQQAGFKVMLPAWWTQRGARRLKARAKPGSGTASSMKTKGNLNAGTIIDFQWEMALGDQTLTRKELEELARLKVPLIRLRGKWYELDAQQLQQALAFLKKKQQTMTLFELLMLSLGAAEPAAGLPFDGIVGDGTLRELLEQFQGDAKFAEIETPPHFTGSLRPYQSRGYSWLNFLSSWGLGACLADDMGLGKTVQTLALLEKRWHEMPPAKRRPVLLVCPMSVVGNWQKEAAKFTPDLPVMVHHGAARKKGEQFVEEASRNAVVLSSYSLLHRDKDLLAAVLWSAIILDEAQNVKNPHTQQSRAARALHSDYRIALTGTPVENNVGDLWSIMEFLNPGLLGSETHFKREFLVPIQVDRDEESVARLQKLTGPFILRRLKTDKSIIKDLPEKMEFKDFCNLTREQATLYQAVVRETEDALSSAEGIERKGIVLGTLMKLKQICNHPALFLHDNSSLPNRSGKLARVTEMVEEFIQVGDRALIFTQFAEMGEMLKQHLQEFTGQQVLFLHGGTNKKKRDQMVELFQSQESDVTVFILSLKAGGVGLNLTGANQVIHFDRWWNPAVENQATDRAFRIGQTRAVQVHKFVCTGTLEERIDELIESKQEIARSVIGTGESWLSDLTNDQLKDLFQLSKDAVSE